MEDEIFEFQVRREYVFEDLLEETKKVRFHPLKRVKVSHNVLSTYVSSYMYVYIHFRRGLWVNLGVI